MPVCGGDGDPDPGNDFKASTTHAGTAAHWTRRTSAVRPTNTSAEALGHDAASIDAKFASVIESNFSGADAEQRLNRLSDTELAAIAHHYQANAGTQNTPLLHTFAARLSDASLMRVGGAFGQAATAAAVQRYASAPVRASFLAKSSAIPALTPVDSANSAPGTTAGPAPTIDMTLEEIYLEYRTAPVGSLSPASAMAETAMFASQRVFWSATVGTAVGTGISALITKYDPSLGDSIGGTIGGTIEAAELAETEVERGHYQSAYDALFDYPVTDYTAVNVQFDSDWNVAEPMDEYYDDGGGCGW